MLYPSKESGVLCGKCAMDTVAVNPVACESCRTKKCKCDRTLPTCSQCAKASSACVYPQISKRGFPEGYLSGLEQRLIDTEWALFESIADSLSFEVSQSVQQAFYSLAEKQTKTARAEDWQRLPIRPPENRIQWFNEKLGALDLNPSNQLRFTEAMSAAAVTSMNSQMQPNSRPVQDISPNTTPPEHFDHVIAARSSGTSWQQSPEASIAENSSNPSVTEQSTQASRLAERYSHRFF